MKCNAGLKWLSMLSEYETNAKDNKVIATFIVNFKPCSTYI